MPGALWGELKPTDTGKLPDIRDNTAFDEFNQHHTNPSADSLWMDLDIEAGWLFTAVNNGFEIWDAGPDDSANCIVDTNKVGEGTADEPARCSYSGRSSFPNWPTDPHESNPVRTIAAPPGVHTKVAVGLAADGGLAVFNTTSKTSPTARYGDTDKAILQTIAARVGSTNYSFSASPDAGLLVHDLDAAANRNTLCIEKTPNQTTCGVYRGRIGTRTFSYVTGVGNSTNSKYWVAASSGSRAFGMELWDVSNPVAPKRILSGLPTEFVHGLALWGNGSNYYLAARTQAITRIFDMSCLATSSCAGSLGPVRWSRSLPGASASNFLTHSSTGSRQFLHVGNFNRCASGTQNEWLFDVTVPNSARDITPADKSVAGEVTGYWGWYYRKNPTGFNHVAPRIGKFNGQYFYRAAYSLLDIHELTSGGAPLASFTYSPTTVYRNQPVDFSDRSLGLPTGWNWSFGSNATPASSVAQSPQDVVFGGLGAQTVTLSASNSFGSDDVSQTINVLNPDASVGGLSATPNPALRCVPITLEALNISGFPEPTKSWEIRDQNDVVVATAGDVNPFVWETIDQSPGVSPGPTDPYPAGTYTAKVTVNNGTTKSATRSLTLLALPSLPPAGGFLPTNDAFTGGTVQFHVAAAGATEWRWDFGDGSTSVWSSDPVTGPNPVHTYTAVGNYTVTVRVRNCIEGARESGPLVAAILRVEPLVAAFQATSGVSCFGNFCEAQVNTPITFNDMSAGNPTAYSYDFDNTGSSPSSCSFGAPSATPDESHTYTQQGNYRPCLKVTRGLEESIDVHPVISVVRSNTVPPSVSVNGPASGDRGQALTFGAIASNCSPVPTQWTWDVGSGGSIAGPTTGNSISVTYGTAGTKSVRASAANGGCAGTSGSRSVRINSDDPGGGGVTLKARFLFTPSDPKPGQAVSFDASTSTGSPGGYSWNFGDGSTGSGVSPSHAYQKAGTYSVTLELSKIDNTCPPFGVCTDTVTQSVVVASGAPLFVASFDTNASCDAFSCHVETGNPVSFNSTTENATSHAWNFGDGTLESGASVNHTWSKPGTYLVSLTVRNNDGQEDVADLLFEVEGEAPPEIQTLVLPWIADTSGALDQYSDLYVYNPNDAQIKVELQFRKRGLREEPPPTATRTLAPNATLYIPDVLETLFARDETSGFLVVSTEDSPIAPVLMSMNRTFQPDGSVYGQMVPGMSLIELDALAGAGAGQQYLLGLSDTDERSAYFGLTNPHDSAAEYRLRFRNLLGEMIAESSQELVLGPWSQKQFQLRELRDLFGLVGAQDYRVEIEQISGGTLFPYAGLVRAGTQDPAFVRVSVPDLSRTYLVGAASTPGFNDAFFLTDTVVSNPTAELMQVDVSYRNVGNGAESLGPSTFSLLPGETQRISDILFSVFDLHQSVGVLTFESTGASGLFPMIHGETYQDSGPLSRYGLFMPARSPAEAAGIGERVLLTGLRQEEGQANTTLWLFNPSDQPGLYDLVFYALDGSELGREEGYAVSAGGMRQINPSRLPLPAGGVKDGFTVDIEVRSGLLIGAAQVVINQSNDPAYVAGAVR